MQQGGRIHKLNKRAFTQTLSCHPGNHGKSIGSWYLCSVIILTTTPHTHTHDNGSVEIPLTGRSKVPEGLHSIWALKMATTEEDRE